MPNNPQYLSLSLREVITRNDNARRIIAGFSSDMPTLGEIWRYLEDALSDVPVLSEEIARLSSELRDTRLDRADLMAAARATIAAYRESEPDPLFYLIDELKTQTSDTPADSRDRR